MMYTTAKAVLYLNGVGQLFHVSDSATPMIQIRKGKNPICPYEVKVGATVRLFSDKSNAFSYAYKEQNAIIEYLIQKIKMTHKIVVEPEVEE